MGNASSTWHSNWLLKPNRNMSHVNDDLTRSSTSGLNALPLELWMSILDFFPLPELWLWRGVCLTWYAYIERAMWMRLPKELWLEYRVYNMHGTLALVDTPTEFKTGGGEKVYAWPCVSFDGWYFSFLLHVWPPAQRQWILDKSLLKIRSSGCITDLLIGIAGYRLVLSKLRGVRFNKASDTLKIDSKLLFSTILSHARGRQAGTNTVGTESLG